MVDIPSFAKDVADTVVPILPYIAIAGKEAVKEVGKNIGGAITEKSKKIWALLRHKVENSPSALETVKKVATNPTDKESLQSFENELIQILNENSELVEKLSKIVITQPSQQQQINVHGDIGKQINIQRINKIDKLEL